MVEPSDKREREREREREGGLAKFVMFVRMSREQPLEVGGVAEEIEG